MAKIKKKVTVHAEEDVEQGQHSFIAGEDVEQGQHSFIPGEDVEQGQHSFIAGEDVEQGQHSFIAGEDVEQGQHSFIAGEDVEQGQHSFIADQEPLSTESSHKPIVTSFSTYSQGINFRVAGELEKSDSNSSGTLIFQGLIENAYPGSPFLDTQNQKM
ncbi:hypothetical protein STEG23_034412 [Scotinomys teguina]